MIPEPKYGWDSSYMCVLAMAKNLRDAGQYDHALSIVQGFLRSGFHKDYQDGPYFWLGTILFEKGDLAEAHAYLDKAHGMSQGRCFREEDPRYKAFWTQWKTKGRAN